MLLAVGPAVEEMAAMRHTADCIVRRDCSTGCRVSDGCPRPGVLYRAYPGKWQILRREGADQGALRLIHEQDEMPALKTVSLEILA